MTEYSKYHVLDSKTGEPFTMINESLCRQQKIDDITLEKIKKLHAYRRQITEYMKTVDPSSSEILKGEALEVTAVDFELQYLWGFPRDQNYHKFWELPHCTCPETDGRERLGTPYHIYNNDCPIHGGFNE